MKIKEKIENWIREVLGSDARVELVHPKDLKNGDYSFFYFGEDLEGDTAKLEGNKIKEVERMEAVGKFVNFYLSKDFFANSVKEILKEGEDYGGNDLLKDQKIIIEYTNTNVLKPFHIGHLMGNVIGQSLSNIFESSGAEVKRNTYQGDSGLHIAKAVWGIQKLGGIKDGNISDQTKYIGEAYAFGANKYEEDEKAQEEIKNINQKIFEKSDHDLVSIYEWGRGVSLLHFEELYKKLNTKLDYYFFESEVTADALEIVKEFLKKGVFEESDGAVVFKGEKHDPKLHTRVFVSSQGIPMYEAKDIAHALRKEKVYKSDTSIIVTANEQDGYFKVVLKALEQINPEISKKTKHLSHGILKLADGKMSSRKGNVITGESLIEDVENLVQEKIKDRDFSEEEKSQVREVVAVGAIKFSILRQAIGGDIIFDFEKSLSFEGDSGPYLQYTAVRAGSVLEKVKESEVFLEKDFELENLADWQATDLEKVLYKFPEVVEKSALEYSPHHLVTYLIELSSLFNGFYANHKILDEADPLSGYKIMLTRATAMVIKNGLNLLGIKVPKRM